MAGQNIEAGKIVPDELIAAHVAGARDSFAEAHPRLDRAELDELVQVVSDWSHSDSILVFHRFETNKLTMSPQVWFHRNYGISNRRTSNNFKTSTQNN